MMRAVVLGVGVATGLAMACVAGEPAPKVRAERPRLFVRAKAWDGPSVEKIKGWMERPEYKQAMGQISTCGNAIRYVILGDADSGRKAAATLKGLTVPKGPGESPSYDGIAVTETALLYDWLRDHPDMDDAGRGRTLRSRPVDATGDPR